MIGTRKRDATHYRYFNTDTPNKCPKTLNMDLPGAKMNSEPLTTNQLASERRSSNTQAKVCTTLKYSGNESAFSIFTKKPQTSNQTRVPNDSSDQKPSEHTFTA